MKTWLFVLALPSLLFFSKTAMAATAYIPPELVTEQQILTQKVIENSNAETRFELAMNYAYTGWIELGWDQLKRVPDYDKNYADKVIQKYSKRISDDPKDWRNYFKLAFGYYFKDKKDLALAMFKKAYEINPKQAWALGFVAFLYGEKGDYKTAIEYAKKALVIEPNGTALHFLLAQGYLKTGNYFGFLGESMHVVHLKSAEAHYRPTPP